MLSRCFRPLAIAHPILGRRLRERVEIRTRYRNEKSIQVDFTADWLNQQGEWGLPIYEVPDLAPGCTIVDVSKLRQSFEAITTAPAK
jgi:hypothetical protein